MLTINFSAEELNLLLAILQEAPYKTVKSVIDSIIKQAQEAQARPEPTLVQE